MLEKLKDDSIKSAKDVMALTRTAHALATPTMNSYGEMLAPAAISPQVRDMIIKSAQMTANNGRRPIGESELMAALASGNQDAVVMAALKGMGTSYQAGQIHGSKRPMPKGIFEKLGGLMTTVGRMTRPSPTMAVADEQEQE